MRCSLRQQIKTMSWLDGVSIKTEFGFFWLAVHSVEKYLKAALLMNDRSAKGYSHNIPELYAAVTPLAPELFPTILTKPEERMPVEYWRSETAETFITRLYQNGQALSNFRLQQTRGRPVEAGSSGL